MTGDAESKKFVITRLVRVIQNNVDAPNKSGHDDLGCAVYPLVTPRFMRGIQFSGRGVLLDADQFQVDDQVVAGQRMIAVDGDLLVIEG